VHSAEYQSDGPLRLLRSFHRTYLHDGGSPNAPLFVPVGRTLGPRITSPWLHLLLTWLPLASPIGTPWTGKSIRSRAATAANAVGVPLSVVAAYMEHKSTLTTARHYVDARILPTAAAWVFFGRYISDRTDYPGPFRTGGYA